MLKIKREKVPTNLVKQAAGHRCPMESKSPSGIRAQPPVSKPPTHVKGMASGVNRYYEKYHAW